MAKKKTRKEVEAQLNLLYWLKQQRNLTTAIEKAINILVDMQYDGTGIEVEKDDEYTKEFLEFWAIYPKKVGKGDAYRKWQQVAKAKKTQERIMHSVQKHKRGDRWKEENGKYIPNPATFLHQKRFDDEVEVPEEKQERQQAAIPRCEHGYPTYVACPECLKEKENG